MGQLKVFVCADHDGFWPVGVASVVVAHDEAEAQEILRLALIGRGLKDKPFTLKLVDVATPHVLIICDGNY